MKICLINPWYCKSCCANGADRFVQRYNL